MSYICGFGSIISAEGCRKVPLTTYSLEGHKYVNSVVQKEKGLLGFFDLKYPEQCWDQRG